MKTITTITTLFLMGLPLLIVVSCKKPSGVDIVSDKTDIFIRETIHVKAQGDNVSVFQWTFNDADSTYTWDTRLSAIPITPQKIGTSSLKLVAYYKNRKKGVEAASAINVNVKKLNTNLLGTYNVKDTTWDYATSSKKFNDYTVKIEDGGDAYGETVIVTNFGNISSLATQRVKLKISMPEGSSLINFSEFSNLGQSPFANKNIYYRVMFMDGFPKLGAKNFKTQGGIHDRTVTYKTGVTALYFGANSYWTKK
jgi:hypothetical protein